MVSVIPIVWPPAPPIPPPLHDILRVSKLFLTFLSIAMAILCAIIIRGTRTISREYARLLYVLIIVATQFDVYSQLILDPQYTTSMFCVYRDTPLFNIPLNAAWGFVIWIGLVTMHPPAYAACFIHRHQIVVPPDSTFKLHPYTRTIFLVGLSIVCLSYGYTYYLAWEPEQKPRMQAVMTSEFNQQMRDGIDCIPGYPVLRAIWALVLVLGSFVFVAAISLHTFAILRHAGNISAKTRSFHRIMIQSLIVLSTVPLALIAIPFSIVCVYYFYFNKLGLHLMDYCTLVNAFHSVVHSSMLILTTPVFRKRIFEMLFGNVIRRLSISPTGESPTSGYFTNVQHRN